MDLPDIVIEAAVEVHRLLGGPGLVESVYEAALHHELGLRGVKSQRQVPIPVLYKGVEVREPLYLDLLVNQIGVVEVKSQPKDSPFFQAQLLTHLRFLRKTWGLLINFGKPNLRDGVCRLINDEIFYTTLV